ncbi:MAG: hypothetical protein DCC48_17115 [Acidobacteria bacterium]|nr:MAG: hypothetical protein DCC48_17115 [Acidobacteriota bacterium]
MNVSAYADHVAHQAAAGPFGSLLTHAVAAPEQAVGQAQRPPRTPDVVWAALDAAAAPSSSPARDAPSKPAPTRRRTTTTVKAPTLFGP